jgi:2-oxoglutarate ferredoxin oxidoreductase subunit beta
MAAGASFVARGTVYHVTELDRLMERAMRKQGFSVVEAVSYCHTTFGRANATKSPVQMMRLLKDNSITVRAAEKLAEEADGSKIVRGVFRDEEKLEFTELYDRVIEQAHGPLSPRKRKVRRGWI